MFANVSEDFFNKLSVEKNSATRLGGLSGNSLIRYTSPVLLPIRMLPRSRQRSIISRHIPSFEVVAKSIKALNHEGHEEHKGKEKLFFVLFVVPSLTSRSGGETLGVYPKNGD